jgi:hypothetical protein
VFLVGNGAAGPVPFIQTAAHEILVGDALAEGAALNRQAMAEAVDNEHRLRMDQVGNLGNCRFRIISL